MFSMNDRKRIYWLYFSTDIKENFVQLLKCVFNLSHWLGLLWARSLCTYLLCHFWHVHFSSSLYIQNEIAKCVSLLFWGCKDSAVEKDKAGKLGWHLPIFILADSSLSVDWALVRTPKFLDSFKAMSKSRLPIGRVHCNFREIFISWTHPMSLVCANKCIYIVLDYCTHMGFVFDFQFSCHQTYILFLCFDNFIVLFQCIMFLSVIYHYKYKLLLLLRNLRQNLLWFVYDCDCKHD